MSLSVIEPLRRRYGVTCSLEEFHETVNIVFHDVESEVYDDVHRDMWLSLPKQFDLLSSDVLKLVPEGELIALDIGCGTGLSSELLLHTELGSRIRHLHLLDTSPKMLERSRQRLSGRGIQLEFQNGITSDVVASKAFDVILTCSVLHHIPELAAFGRDIRRMQKPRGVFLHLQDPNADSAASPLRIQREALYRRRCRPLLPGSVRRFLPDNVAAAVWRRVTGRQKKTYLDRVNDELLHRGTIRRPMHPPDIWAVTDIHIGNGEGVSAGHLAAYLPAHRLVAKRTYGFFSVLASSLPPDLRELEEEWTEAGSQEGSYLAASWQLQA